MISKYLGAALMLFAFSYCMGDQLPTLIAISQPTPVYELPDTSSTRIREMPAGHELFYDPRTNSEPFHRVGNWVAWKIDLLGVKEDGWVKSVDLASPHDFRRVQDCWPFKKTSGSEGEDPFQEAVFTRQGNARLEFAGGEFIRGAVFMAGDAVFVAERKGKKWQPVYNFAYDRKANSLLPDGSPPVEPSVSFSADEMKGCTGIRLSDERMKQGTNTR